jgi:hypothetical protein
MMPHSYPKNDWDSFEELHIIVEQFELCQGLLRSRSHSKARAAVILLDHVADVLMYRVCNDDFEFQAFQEMISPPAVPAKKRAEILFRFDAKVSYLSQKKRLMSDENASVLLISHRIRNFAYHRDYHNPKTISVIGRILYKTVCEILPILAKRGQVSYSSNTKEQAWTKRYGVTAELFKFPEALQHISDYLGQRIKITPYSAARSIRADLFVRYKRMRRTMDHSLGLKKDKALNDMLKHYEFADVHSEELEKFRQPVKNARYMVYELHKELPPEEWPRLVVRPEKRREIRRAMIVAERAFKAQYRKAFRDFRQTITAESLRSMSRKIRGLSAAPSLNYLLSQYDFLERQLTRVEAYVDRAEGDFDFAIDLARGK